jgi:hypothetical protein
MATGSAVKRTNEEEIRSNGGPVFPTDVMLNSDSVIHPKVVPGISLRDYLAAKAMQGWRALGLSSSSADSTVYTYWSADRIAALAYKDADAMLKAREQ